MIIYLAQLQQTGALILFKKIKRKKDLFICLCHLLVAACRMQFLQLNRPLHWEYCIRGTDYGGEVPDAFTLGPQCTRQEIYLLRPGCLVIAVLSSLYFLCIFHALIEGKLRVMHLKMIHSGFHHCSSPRTRYMSQFELRQESHKPCQSIYPPSRWR